MIRVAELDALRAEMSEILSERRFSHSLGVERAALEIGRHCLPDKLSELSAAALLHDVAKEASREDQLAAMYRSGVEFTDEDYSSAALYHSFAAPQIVKERFPHFATDEILSAIFTHTSGGEAMTIFDEIIFIADFVDDTRPYDACKMAREKLFSDLEAAKTREDKVCALHKSVISVIDFTIDYLENKGKSVNSRMLLAKSALEGKIS